MTKVIFSESNDGIYFEVMEHAGNTEACIAVSSICNVLICYMDRFASYSQDEFRYEPGHVKCVYDGIVTEATSRIFRAAYEALKAAAEEFPGAIKVY